MRIPLIKEKTWEFFISNLLASLCTSGEISEKGGALCVLRICTKCIAAFPQARRSWCKSCTNDRERERADGELAAFFHFSTAAREAPAPVLISSHVTRGSAHAHYRAAASTWSVGRSVLISGNPGQTFLLQLLSAGDASNSLSALGMEVSECVLWLRLPPPGRRPRQVHGGAGTRRRPPRGPFESFREMLTRSSAHFVACICVRLCVCVVRFLLLFVDGWERAIVVDDWSVRVEHRGRFLLATCDLQSFVSRFRFAIICFEFVRLIGFALWQVQCCGHSEDFLRARKT